MTRHMNLIFITASSLIRIVVRLTGTKLSSKLGTLFKKLQYLVWFGGISKIFSLKAASVVT